MDLIELPWLSFVQTLLLVLLLILRIYWSKPNPRLDAAIDKILDVLSSIEE